MPKFLQKNGLTRYSLACGNLQVCRTTTPDHAFEIRLEQDSACWHVKVRHEGHGRMVWESFAGLGEARKYWALMVRNYLGSAIKTVREDTRYSVEQEYSGHEDPMWVVRFCGNWVVQRDNREAAWAAAYDHSKGRALFE